MLFMCVRLFMLLIRKSLFIVFTQERLLMVFKFTYTVQKVKLLLYYFYTYIFDFILHFSCLNGCVVWKLCSRLEA